MKLEEIRPGVMVRIPNAESGRTLIGVTHSILDTKGLVEVMLWFGGSASSSLFYPSDIEKY